MITTQEWNRIRAYTDQVVNREADEIVFHGGHVRRETSGKIYITLRPMELNLEPDIRRTIDGVLDEMVDGTLRQLKDTCGPGWPD